MVLQVLWIETKVLLDNWINAYLAGCVAHSFRGSHDTGSVSKESLLCGVIGHVIPLNKKIKYLLKWKDFVS